jgi:protein ImuA
MRSADSPASAALDQAAILAALRARLERLEGGGRAVAGLVAIPGLPGGGLARAALHEVLAAAPGCGAAFAAVLLGRSGGTVLWIASAADGLQAWPPGLAGCGLDPADLTLVRAERPQDALWAMEEALRCPAVAGVALALAGGLPLTATRRLQLAAEAGRALGLLLRPEAMAAEPSAALTRWRVAPLPAADSPRWRLELLRAKGSAPDGPWTLAWQAAAQRLRIEGPPAAHRAAR